MRVVLLSTYELGRQSFGLASAAAWLTKAGHQVECADLAISSLPYRAIETAGLIGLSLPMHTATRLACALLPKIRALNESAHICCFGLYAPLNAEYLTSLGAKTILGGECEPALVALASDPNGVANPPVVSLDRLQFRTPDRAGLPSLAQYSRLREGAMSRIAGYTEASRGCKHMCRHCPVVPIYQGAFRVVQRKTVLQDIRQQVASGATHITFGDPDFFNGPAHAVKLVQEMHSEFPDVSYDVTIKIEHLLKHRSLLQDLKATGCSFIISAVESLDDEVLQKLEKGHTRADFLRAAKMVRDTGLCLTPTFIPFTPWTTRRKYADLLSTLVALELIENVSPIQLALRLLITSGSRLLELEDIRGCITGFDRPGLLYRWNHPDPEIDALAASALGCVADGQKQGRTRGEIFRQLWGLVHAEPLYENLSILPRAAIPYLDEPWYC